MDIDAILLKPLDGRPEGREVAFSKEDFAALEAMGAVRRKAAQAPQNKAAPKPATKATKAN